MDYTPEQIEQVKAVVHEATGVAITDDQAVRVLSVMGGGPSSPQGGP